MVDFYSFFNTCHVKTEDNMTVNKNDRLNRFTSLYAIGKDLENELVYIESRKTTGNVGSLKRRFFQ